MTQGRNTPLRMRASNITSVEVVEQLLAVTSRVNQHEERIGAIEVDLMSVVGETSRSNTAVVKQVDILTEALRELRTAILPGGESRAKLITLPNIVIEEVRQVLDEAELNKRRQDSLRAREDTAEKDRLALEDKLATKRDAKNAKVALYTALAIMVLTELLRLAITHSF